MTKVAIIYARAGGGHVSLASAASETLRATGNYEVQTYDPFPSTFSSTHKTLANYFTDVYRIGLKATENPKVFPAINSLNEFTIARKLTKFFEQYRPNVVIVNHPLAAAALPAACEKLDFPIKQIIHFCDPFTTHKTWFINTSADCYLSPTTEMAKLAVNHGIPASRIQTIGWLTRKSFVNGPQDKLLSRQILGLDPQKFTCFIGGAGQGSSLIEDICTLFTQSPALKNAQAIVNTGLNSTLVGQIMRLVQKHNQQLILTPYLPDTSGLLSASDVVVGKAGPNFIFEAIHSLRPIIISGHLPGHEDGNPKFIKAAGLGWVETSPEKVISRLESLIKNPKDIHTKTTVLKKFKSVHSDSATKLVTIVTELTN